jgi:ribosome-associated protein
MTGMILKMSLPYRIWNTVQTLPLLSEVILMEDMLPETKLFRELSQALGKLLHEHNGADVRLLELPQDAWTDFFVIATASSDTHLDGLERHIKEFCQNRGVEILRRSRKPDMTDRALLSGAGDEWRIIDLGSAVIHLMSRKAREFYDLERLYSNSQITEF